MGNEASSQFAGYRVLSVLPGSPGIAANLDSYFDFIVEAAGVRLDSPERPFTDIISQHVGRVLKLKVFNCMTSSERMVDLRPRSGWGGSGLLGITIRFDSFENAMSEVIHVLNVEASSPAEKSGLRPSSDYLLGTSDQVFHDENELAEVCLSFVGQPISVYVYNSVDERVRQVTLTPSYKWGGKGLLGCDIGSGYLHQLPTKKAAGTVSASALAALPSKRVRSNMGRGWVEDVRPDGFMTVKLDWTLANNRPAQLITLEQHLRFLVDETPLPPVQGAPEVGAGNSGIARATESTQIADEIPDDEPIVIGSIDNSGGSGGSSKGNSKPPTMELDLS